MSQLRLLRPIPHVVVGMDLGQSLEKCHVIPFRHIRLVSRLTTAGDSASLKAASDGQCLGTIMVLSIVCPFRSLTIARPTQKFILSKGVSLSGDPMIYAIRQAPLLAYGSARIAIDLVPGNWIILICANWMRVRQ